LTLAAGFKCKDGFVIAADTEITIGDYGHVQGEKLKKYLQSLENRITVYDLICAGAGDISYYEMAAQHIRDAIAHLPQRTYPEIKKAVEQTIAYIYEQFILKYWKINDEGCPAFDLILGIKDQEGCLSILKTDRTAVVEVDTYAMVGTGADKGLVLAEKLYRGTGITSFSSTAWMCHLVLQIFREVKGKGVHVGGNTQLYGRKTKDGEPFFKLKMGDSRYLWGIESDLLSAVRAAVAKSSLLVEGKDLDHLKTSRREIFDERVKALISRLRKLRKLCKKPQEYGGNTINMTDYGTDWMTWEDF